GEARQVLVDRLRGEPDAREFNREWLFVDPLVTVRGRDEVTDQVSRTGGHLGAVGQLVIAEHLGAAGGACWLPVVTSLFHGSNDLRWSGGAAGGEGEDQRDGCKGEESFRGHGAPFWRDGCLRRQHCSTADACGASTAAVLAPPTLVAVESATGVRPPGPVPRAAPRGCVPG